MHYSPQVCWRCRADSEGLYCRACEYDKGIFSRRPGTRMTWIWLSPEVGLHTTIGSSCTAPRHRTGHSPVRQQKTKPHHPPISTIRPRDIGTRRGAGTAQRAHGPCVATGAHTRQQYFSPAHSDLRTRPTRGTPSSRRDSTANPESTATGMALMVTVASPTPLLTTMALSMMSCTHTGIGPVPAGNLNSE